ncbi:MAG: trypsin-like peptidase domain-containing protein [Cyclobacteriaceae bacterium]|nr:trypsin-like peptidase domain-containing protein [Cyclobacteriaceae bacterium]MCH8515221.1 trypsin-like peptidase domain-containing protein [Cyclobacteriaceae bacterium]
MNKRLFFLGILVASLVGGLSSILLMNLFGFTKSNSKESISEKQFKGSSAYDMSSYRDDSTFIVPEGLNFITAAERVTPGVVHIKTTVNVRRRGARSPIDQFFEEFHGGRERSPGQARSSGSGVIISEDGYVCTNFHVIENASKIELTLDDNRTYEAQVIGTDPTTDLALLKIVTDRNETFPFVRFGNSEEVKIGEWVLAVGNPFNLTSTVTAGIVSAKGRNINILRTQDNMQIEAFIQTDAAVNPGNSGGALVNLRGDLVGINTAIATPSGSFAGYSFAVPVSLVNKVMDDLLEFGVVQRALLGVRIISVNSEIAREFGLNTNVGIYVSDVGENSAAKDADLREGDVIIGINDRRVVDVAQLQEMIATKRPGDKVKVAYLRNGKEDKVYVTLKNADGEIDVIVKAASIVIEGSTFGNPKSDLLADLEIKGGAQLKEKGSGKWEEFDVREGFIITHIDKQKINEIKDLKEVLEEKKGGILIEGIYPNGKKAYYATGW